MAEHSSPYIQTIHTFSEEVLHYGIQPIERQDETEAREERPMLAFGPIGRINIFVGATNSGKSRFLRALAKNQQYFFYPSEEVLQACRTLLIQVEKLARTEGKVSLIVRFGNYNYSNVVGRNPIERAVPDWAKEAMAGLSYSSSFDLVLDKAFFQNLQEDLRPFIKQRFEKNSENVSAKKGSVINEPQQFDVFEHRSDISNGLIAYKLLRGELMALEKDEQTRRDMAGKTQYEIEKKLLSITRNPLGDQFVFDHSQASVDFKAAVISFWDAFEKVRGMEKVAAFKPPSRIYIPTLRSAVRWWLNVRCCRNLRAWFYYGAKRVGVRS